jgi:cysteinyl-tRNA synthetase
MLIYNTLSKKKEEFIPQEKNKVQMYVCGPTVYNYFHIGNARPFLFFDVVRKYLRYIGYQVTYIQNITDIDDKIIQSANEQGVDYSAFTQKYIEAFFTDLKRLHIDVADENPRATDFVPEMVALIQELVTKGYAYESNHDVYFEVSKVKEYGFLSGKNLDELQVGARVEENKQKKSPFDFTLWKKAKENEPSWESPWGRGRPGWHTECVVMSKKYLGKFFDIHGGGIDLMFPHHENEVAQAIAIDGNPHAKHWMHNGFLNIDGEKMGKSKNNFFFTRDVLKVYDADTIRFFYLSKHYRSPIDYYREILDESQSAMNRFYEVFRKYPQVTHDLSIEQYKGESHDTLSPHLHEIKAQFIDAMNDDFNTAKAIATLFELCKIANTDESIGTDATSLLYELGSVLGFFADLAQKLSPKVDDKTSELINLLIDIRTQAKKDKNFTLADKIRDDLKRFGIELRDTPNGVEWRAD